MTDPTNLRAVSATVLQFDGDPEYGYYDLLYRPSQASCADDNLYTGIKTWQRYGAVKANVCEKVECGPGSWQFIVVDRNTYHPAFATQHRTGMIGRIN